MNIYESTVIDAPVSDVWDILRDFVGLVAWSNAVTAAHIVNEKAADQVGAIRQLDIVDGTIFVETLVALSDDEMFLKYDIVDGPIPVTNYVATMRVYPVTATSQTFAIWSAQFDCSEDQRQAMQAVVGGQICAGGLRSLKAYFEKKN